MTEFTMREKSPEIREKPPLTARARTIMEYGSQSGNSVVFRSQYAPRPKPAMPIERSNQPSIVIVTEARIKILDGAAEIRTPVTGPPAPSDRPSYTTAPSQVLFYSCERKYK